MGVYVVFIYNCPVKPLTHSFVLLSDLIMIAGSSLQFLTDDWHVTNHLLIPDKIQICFICHISQLFSAQWCISKDEVPPRLEFWSLDSKSRVSTITPLDLLDCCTVTSFYNILNVILKKHCIHRLTTDIRGTCEIHECWWCLLKFPGGGVRSGWETGGDFFFFFFFVTEEMHV